MIQTARRLATVATKQLMALPLAERSATRHAIATESPAADCSMSDVLTTKPVQRISPRLVNFNWRSVTYAVLLLITSFCLFGPTGFFVCLIVLAGWSYIFLCDAKPIALGIVGMLGLSIYLCLTCLLSLADPEHKRHFHSGCKNNMKQIMLAMHNYHDEYGSFPPAYVADANGRPMHSWRVLLLPHLGRQDLYDLYRFDEPWNSKNNRKLLEVSPNVYACPSSNAWDEKEFSTSYAAVVGPETCWPESGSRKLHEIVDGPSKTVAIIETQHNNIPWTEPRDIDLNRAAQLLSLNNQTMQGVHHHHSFFYEFASYCHFATADGAVHSARAGLSPADARKRLVVNDTTTTSNPPSESAAFQPYKTLRIYNTVCFSLFALLVTLPLPWVWIRPRTQPAKREPL